MKSNRFRFMIGVAFVALYLGPLWFMWQHLHRQRALDSSASHEGSISVSDYGAVGDGVTDDSAAFAAALADADKYARALLIPKHTYMINRQLDIRSSGPMVQLSRIRIAPSTFCLPPVLIVG